MWIAIGIFIVVYGLMITERLDRTAAAIFGAALMLLVRCIPYDHALAHIDLDVVFLLIGMMVAVDILAQTGLFEWVAIYIAQRARGNPVIILLGLLGATALLSAFLDNVTTVVLMAPVTILITQILELPTVPFLILSVLFSNIGGTATLIGDPPNIIIGARSGLSFNAFIVHLAPVVLLCMGVLFAGIFALKGASLKTSTALRTRIMKANPARAILDPWRLKRGLVVFFITLVGFSVSHFLGLQPGIIAMTGAFCMVVVTRSSLRAAMIKVEWETILFLMGLFMMVGALEYNGLFERVSELLFSLTQGHLFATALLVLWSSALLSAFLGNIPVVIAMVPLVNSLIGSTQLEVAADAEVLNTFVAAPLWWSLALGACFGGNGTLYGAAANVVVSQIAKRNGYQIAFWEFLRFSVPVTLITLVMASGYIYLCYFFFSPL